MRRRRGGRRAARPGPSPAPVRGGADGRRAAAAGGSLPVPGGALLAALLLAGLVPASLGAQLRRAPAVPYVPDGAGRLLVGAGAGWEAGAEFPLSGLSGDLARLGRITVAYSFAPGAVLHVEGDALRVLEVESRGPSRVPLDPDVDDGVTRDAGDVRVATLVRLLGDARGLSGGLHLRMELPSSDERKGIGTNTTDVAGSVFASWARGPVRLTGDVGVAVLEAPTEPFVQNDVVVYAAEALLRPAGAAVGLSLSARGRASTRGVVPPGTEDRGRTRLLGELRLGPWRVDAGVTAGHAGASPDWGVEAGAARVVGF